ncbi:hypothetical protein [Blastococcus sp. PRF04-17]|uniref:hypothetical protein n=1 Tax=Blastococcus sp. PRF04-17 TaxID=2933797 RepID=UPI001FF38EE9|nr:hypothetical protein [Blastococcus sp. PRF04-17]UOY02965.1 hypothetical protein MVA48_06340 [Blastococcus sp. PRF04-17]
MPVPPDPWPDSRPQPGPPLARRAQLHRLAVRWAGNVVVVLYVGVALPGALVTPWVGMLVIAPAIGLLSALVAVLVEPKLFRDPARRHVVVHVAVAGFLLAPFTAGVAASGAVGGTALFVLVVLGTFVAGDRAFAWVGSPDAPDAPDVPDVAAVRAGLHTLPTARLLHDWETTERLLRSPRHAPVAAELRALLLDELGRREPEAVNRWLTDGGTSPAGYIGNDRDPAD